MFPRTPTLRSGGLKLSYIKYGKCGSQNVIKPVSYWELAFLLYLFFMADSILVSPHLGTLSAHLSEISAYF